MLKREYNVKNDSIAESFCNSEPNNNSYYSSSTEFQDTSRGIADGCSSEVSEISLVNNPPQSTTDPSSSNLTESSFLQTGICCPPNSSCSLNSSDVVDVSSSLDLSGISNNSAEFSNSFSPKNHSSTLNFTFLNLNDSVQSGYEGDNEESFIKSSDHSNGQSKMPLFFRENGRTASASTNSSNSLSNQLSQKNRFK